MKKFAVILSGCGFQDGSEINEAVFCLLALSRYSIAYDIFAPNIVQNIVKNHLNNTDMNEERNVLVESARIARGNITDLSLLDMSNYDALILPGGAGVCLNISTYNLDGVNMKVNADLERIILDCHKQRKAIGAVCIAPVIIAKLLTKVSITLGHSEMSAKIIEDLGAKHYTLDSNDVCIDHEHLIVTTPAFMNNASLADIYCGVEKMIETIISFN